jgi:hypothetical protein
VPHRWSSKRRARWSRSWSRPRRYDVIQWIRSPLKDSQGGDQCHDDAGRHLLNILSRVLWLRLPGASAFRFRIKPKKRAGGKPPARLFLGFENFFYFSLKNYCWMN